MDAGEEQITSAILARLARWTAVDVVGPLNLDDVSTRPLFAAALSLRRAHSLKRAPYLEAEEQQQLERRLAIDARSFHFVASTGDRVVASVRLTPPPYEISELLPNFDLRAFDDYLEFGRLCIADLSQLERLEATSKLLFTAALWSFTHVNCRGIVALCRPAAVPFMGRIGLALVADGLHVAERGQDYAVMAATREALFEHQGLMLGRSSGSLWVIEKRG